MCGIGLLFSKSKSKSARHEIGCKMVESIRHRGPDAQEVWSDDFGMTLVHARLSILDLSATGRQPMVSSRGRWMIVFNGEIYNHTEIRAQYLPDLHFRGSSDTETLIELVEKFGPVGAIQKTRGMFALALYDLEKRQLHLFRDRVGEKPLYYGFIGKDFIVGSELKVFLAHAEFKRQINPEALHQFLRFAYVPQPLSIFEGVHKLPPASHLVLDLQSERIEPAQSYWKMPLSKNAIAFDTDAQSKIKSKLLEAVQIQMRSDVPYGCFLSGGVDSSAIAALMQVQSKSKVKTFSIGFDSESFNEAPFAKKIAQHLDTDHSEWILSSQDAKDVIPKLPLIYDEPFADSSQIPTFLLSKMTRSKVTVSLSGDGGDELFCGYNRYLWTEKLWNMLKLCPEPVRLWAARSGHTPAPMVGKIYRQLLPVLPSSVKVSQIDDKLQKILGFLSARSERELYLKSLSFWKEPNQVLLQKSQYAVPDAEAYKEAELKSFMMWHDQTHYLPDDIMAKVDRASMAVSLEGRAPFLDHELIELVCKLPLNQRVGNHPKQILRDILYQHVPRKLIERPKMGFSIPLSQWLKGDFKGMTQDLLHPDRIQQQGLFDTAAIARVLEEFYQKDMPRENLIWPLLVFQLWHQKWLN
jgi:asparagine synthase (glutamine-hydrolysing)